MRRAITAIAILLTVVGALSAPLLVPDHEDRAVPIVTAADSCVYTLGSSTEADRQNARAIVEADADRMFALALRDGQWAHTHSRMFGPNVDPAHCATGVNYGVDGGKHGVSFTVDLTTRQVVDVR